MKSWPHSPSHRLSEKGAFIVTCGTYRKEHHLLSSDRLTLFRDALFELAERYGWQLQAWAVMSNHYHFVAKSPEDPANLGRFVGHLHTSTATQVNRLDGTPGRKVWHEYWDTLITNQRSYFARLNYVQQNPVHHGLVLRAHTYPWCSAAWFEATADQVLYKTVCGFKIDRVLVPDEFEPEGHA